MYVLIIISILLMRGSQVGSEFRVKTREGVPLGSTPMEVRGSEQAWTEGDGERRCRPDDDLS